VAASLVQTHHPWGRLDIKFVVKGLAKLVVLIFISLQLFLVQFSVKISVMSAFLFGVMR
jgi:hypothetical protein